jgi:hypothetical protein
LISVSKRNVQKTLERQKEEKAENVRKCEKETKKNVSVRTQWQRVKAGK